MAVNYTTWSPPIGYGWFAAECHAKDTDYGRLLDLLQASPIALSWDVLINRFGQWMPYEASQLVSFLRGGTVWIDYCCWPMFYKRSGTFPGYMQAPTLVSEFFQAAGRPLGAWPYMGVWPGQYVIFNLKNVFWRCLPRYMPWRCVDGVIPDTSYMWDWGMVVDVDITKYPEFRVDPELRKASGTGEYTFPSLPDMPQPVKVWIYNHFALRVGSGWYFWAYRRADGEGIAPEKYAAFITSVLGAATPPAPTPTPTPIPTPLPPPSPGCNPSQCATRPTLRRGDQGPCVGLAQQLLVRAGFDPGPIDCAFGPRTESAVRRFQAAKGLTVDGIVGPQTWAALEAAAPVPSGAKEQCIARGGTWDEARQVCALPEKAIDWKTYAMYGGALLLVGAGVYLLVKGLGE